MLILCSSSRSTSMAHFRHIAAFAIEGMGMGREGGRRSALALYLQTCTSQPWCTPGICIVRMSCRQFNLKSAAVAAWEKQGIMVAPFWSSLSLADCCSLSWHGCSSESSGADCVCERPTLTDGTIVRSTEQLTAWTCPTFVLKRLRNCATPTPAMLQT